MEKEKYQIITKEIFLKRIKDVYRAEELALITKAFDYAERAHGDQKRESGEPFFTHPVAVAYILAGMELDAATVIAALLHDVAEDTEVTIQNIQDTFGKEIAALVSGVTKLTRISFKSKEEEQAENFRKLFFAMAKDIRILFIKLADRVHNMRTAMVLSEERRNALARETLEIYAPLASRLGLSFIKCELEDLSFQVLKPDEYIRLKNELSTKRSERQSLVDRICTKLKEILAQNNIECEINGRPKHLYSIYNKMKNKDLSIDQIYDLTAVRVIVRRETDCYSVMGIIHANWKYLPGRFKDYISNPKANGYKSIHTTVMTNFGTPFEIQIRTEDMHKVAEFGVAAHWKYKENKSSATELDEKISWLRDIISLQNEIEDSKEFLDSFKIDLYGGKVFVFTPQGDVMILPEGSTPVDFAYELHSELGNKCTGARINSKMVPLNTKLKTGDYVEVMTVNNSKGPSRDWLRFVQTTNAKAKIKAFFRKQMKAENIKTGKDMLELEAKNRGLVFSQLCEQKQVMETVLSNNSFSSIEDMFAAVGSGNATAPRIISKLEGAYKKNEVFKPRAKESNRSGNGVLIAGDSGMLVKIAKCCTPVPFDDIVGYISLGRGVMVHRTNCPNLKGVEEARLIRAEWEEKTTANFVVQMQLIAVDSPGLLVKVSTAISELGLSLASVNARADKNKRVIMDFGVLVSSSQEAEQLMRKIQQLDTVEKVYRISSK